MARQECDYYENEHLHELYKYTDSTITLKGKTIDNIATFTIPKGLWLLYINWYFYTPSNAPWPAGSWYRIGSGEEISNILNYKCMDVNEKCLATIVVENDTDITAQINAYPNESDTNNYTYNVSQFVIKGVKLR